jgi:Uma2 family endonuclease
LDEDEPGELVDGRLEDEEMAGWGHEVVVAWLLATLHAWARLAGARVIGSDAKLAVSERRGRKADLVMYLRSTPRPSATGLIRVAPSVVVEVVSPSPSDARRDRVQKLDEYAAFGVRWYWLVDPQLRTFEIYELAADARYARALGPSEGRIDPVPGCDALVLDLDAMWADLDAALAEAT